MEIADGEVSCGSLAIMTARTNEKNSGPSRFSLIVDIAIAFGYYETLLRLGDKDRILLEETRLRSLNNLLNNVGYPGHVYEDFVDESLLLLRDVADQVPATDQGASLLEKFNDENVSNAIITHFKVSGNPLKTEVLSCGTLGYVFTHH